MDKRTEALHIVFSASASFALVLFSALWLTIYLPVAPLLRISIAATVIPMIWVPLFIYLIHCPNTWQRFMLHSMVAGVWAVPLFRYFLMDFAAFL